jgi:hypothetical protein
LPERPSDEEFANFVDRYLIVRDVKCYRHCQEPAKFESLKIDRPGIVGGYFCPGNYSSRIVYFSLEPDSEWFENFLKERADELVRSRDIRSATRHGWELGGNAENEIKKISNKGLRQYYWTFYPASDEEKTKGAFRCENCGGVFVKGFSDGTKLCTRCS